MMPGVTLDAMRYPGPEKGIDEAADKEREARRKEIDANFEYYFGAHALPLKNEPDGTNASVILNLVEQALDDMTEFVGLPRLELPDGVQREPGASGQLETFKSEDQLALEAWWERQDIAEFLADTLLSGFCAGHTFVKLYLDEDDAIQSYLLDPRECTVFWDKGNRKKPLWYRMEWSEGTDANPQRWRQDLVPGWLLADEDGGAFEGWWIIDYKLNNASRWDETGRDPWEFDFAPVVEWKNSHKPHDYYGRADVRRGLNDAVNFTASNVSKILKHHAGPQTVVTGGQLDEEAETGPGTILELPSAEAKIYNLEMTSDLQSSLQFLEKLEARFFAASRVVDLTTQKDKLGQITNFGVRMLYLRTTKLIDARRRLYGKGLAEISRRALAMGGVEVARVNVHWADMLPVNRKEQAETLKIEKDMGTVSAQTATEEMGRDFDQEQERREEEKVETGEATARILERMGQRGLLQ